MGNKKDKPKTEDKKKLSRDNAGRNPIISFNDKRRAETTKRRMEKKHKKILSYVSRKAKEAGINVPTGGKSPRRDRKNLSKAIKNLRGVSKKEKTRKDLGVVTEGILNAEVRKDT